MSNSPSAASRLENGRVWMQQLERKAKGFLKRSEKGWFYISNGELRRTKPGTKEVNDGDKVVCQLYLSSFREDGGTSFRLMTHTGKEYQFKALNQEQFKDWKEHIIASIEQGLAQLLPAGDKESDENFHERIEALRAANPTCADCGRPEPEWASINLGIIFCHECSGTHRNLGTDVSEVRSLRLDKECWTEECVQHMLSIGNDRSNAEFEAKLDLDDKPLPSSPLEEKRDFIISKYRDVQFASIRAVMRMQVQLGHISQEEADQALKEVGLAPSSSAAQRLRSARRSLRVFFATSVMLGRLYRVRAQSEKTAPAAVRIARRRRIGTAMRHGGHGSARTPPKPIPRPRPKPTPAKPKSRPPVPHHGPPSSRSAPKDSEHRDDNIDVDTVQLLLSRSKAFSDRELIRKASLKKTGSILAQRAPYLGLPTSPPRLPRPKSSPRVRSLAAAADAAAVALDDIRRSDSQDGESSFNLVSLLNGHYQKQLALFDSAARSEGHDIVSTIMFKRSTTVEETQWHTTYARNSVCTWPKSHYPAELYEFSCVHLLQMVNFEAHAVDLHPSTGDSAIHVAAQMGDELAVRMLLQVAEKMVVQPNKAGKTPLQIAFERHQILDRFDPGAPNSHASELQFMTKQLAKLRQRLARIIDMLSIAVDRVTRSPNQLFHEATSMEVIAWVLTFLSPTERRRAATVSHMWAWSSLEAVRLVRLEIEAGMLLERNSKDSATLSASVPHGVRTHDHLSVNTSDFNKVVSNAIRRKSVRDRAQKVTPLIGHNSADASDFAVWLGKVGEQKFSSDEEHLLQLSSEQSNVQWCKDGDESNRLLFSFTGLPAQQVEKVLLQTIEKNDANIGCQGLGGFTPLHAAALKSTMAGESGEQLSSDSGLCDNMFQAAKTQSHEMDDALTESRIVSTTLVKLGADVAALNARGLWPGMLAAGATRAQLFSEMALQVLFSIRRNPTTCPQTTFSPNAQRSYQAGCKFRLHNLPRIDTDRTSSPELNMTTNHSYGDVDLVDIQWGIDSRDLDRWIHFASAPNPTGDVELEAHLRTLCAVLILSVSGTRSVSSHVATRALRRILEVEAIRARWHLDWELTTFLDRVVTTGSQPTNLCFGPSLVDAAAKLATNADVRPSASPSNPSRGLRRQRSALQRFVNSWPVSVSLLQALGGRTALQCAASSGGTEMVSFLLAQGVDSEKETRAIPPHFQPDSVGALNSELYFGLSNPDESTLGPTILEWAGKTRFFTIRAIDCVRDNPQLVNVLSPTRAPMPIFPPPGAGMGAKGNAATASNDDFDTHRAINFFCVAEKTFDADGNMLQHRIIWRYPNTDEESLPFDPNAAILACAAPMHVRCKFAERYDDADGGDLMLPTKYASVMHQEPGLPTVYVTSLSTKVVGNETNDGGGGTTVLALCILSNFNRFSFFEGILQQFYEVAVENLKRESGPLNEEFPRTILSSEFCNCVRSVVDCVNETEFGSVQRLSFQTTTADGEDGMLLPLPKHQLGLPLYVVNKDEQAPENSPFGRVDVDLSCYSLITSPSMPEVDPQCFYALFSCLTVSSVVKIVGHLLTDTKVLLVSSNIALLTPVAEALSALLYPYSWSNNYIPFLPRSMFCYTASPAPIFAGALIDDLMNLVDVAGDGIGYVQVILDTGSVVPPPAFDMTEEEDSGMQLPTSVKKRLVQKLKTFVHVPRSARVQFLQSVSEQGSIALALEDVGVYCSATDKAALREGDAAVLHLDIPNIRSAFAVELGALLADFSLFALNEQYVSNGEEAAFPQQVPIDNHAFLRRHVQTRVFATFCESLSRKVVSLDNTAEDPIAARRMRLFAACRRDPKVLQRLVAPVTMQAAKAKFYEMFQRYDPQWRADETIRRYSKRLKRRRATLVALAQGEQADAVASAAAAAAAAAAVAWADAKTAALPAEYVDSEVGSEDEDSGSDLDDAPVPATAAEESTKSVSKIAEELDVVVDECELSRDAVRLQHVINTIRASDLEDGEVAAAYEDAQDLLQELLSEKNGEQSTQANDDTGSVGGNDDEVNQDDDGSGGFDTDTSIVEGDPVAVFACEADVTDPSADFREAVVTATSANGNSFQVQFTDGGNIEDIDSNLIVVLGDDGGSTMSESLSVGSLEDEDRASTDNSHDHNPNDSTTNIDPDDMSSGVRDSSPDTIDANANTTTPPSQGDAPTQGDSNRPDVASHRESLREPFPSLEANTGFDAPTVDSNSTPRASTPLSFRDAVSGASVKVFKDPEVVAVAQDRADLEWDDGMDKYCGAEGVIVDRDDEDDTVQVEFFDMDDMWFHVSALQHHDIEVLSSTSEKTDTSNVGESSDSSSVTREPHSVTLASPVTVAANYYALRFRSVFQSKMKLLRAQYTIRKSKYSSLGTTAVIIQKVWRKYHYSARK